MKVTNFFLAVKQDRRQNFSFRLLNNNGKRISRWTENIYRRLKKDTTIVFFVRFVNIAINFDIKNWSCEARSMNSTLGKWKNPQRSFHSHLLLLAVDSRILCKCTFCVRTSIYKRRFLFLMFSRQSKKRRALISPCRYLK